MAQLKDTVISGSLRVTDTIYTTTADVSTLKAPTSSGSTAHGVGTSGQALFTNGTASYWGAVPIPTSSQLGLGSMAFKASSDYSGTGHTHTAANITNFNAAAATVTVNNATNAAKVNGTAFGSASTMASGSFLGSATKYAGSTATGGMASVAHSTEKSLTLQINGGTSTAWNGSAAATFNVTTGSLGIGSAGLKASSDFAASSHNHTTANITNFNTAVKAIKVDNATSADNAELADRAITADDAMQAASAAFAKRRVFIQGTQTTATTTGKWTGDASPYFNSVDDLVDGQEITYWLPLPTTGNVTLNLKFGDGTSSGEVLCYYGNTSRLTTHYGQGNAIHLTYRKNVKIPSTGTNTYTGWWADANYDSNTNSIDTLQGTYTIPVAGATAGVKQYSLFAEDANGKYSSFTTQNGTAATKTVNRTDYFDISKIYYSATAGNYGTNANIGASMFRWVAGIVDLRYTLNIANGTNGLTARKPLYLKFDAESSTIGTEGRPCYKLAGTAINDWWTQTLPSSADGIIYVKVSEAVWDWYRADLAVKQKFYKYGSDVVQGYDALSAYRASFADRATTAANAEFATYAVNDANGKDIRTQYLTTAYAPTREEILAPIGSVCSYSGSYAVALGQNSTASENYSFASGGYTITPKENSAVFGLYNASTASSMTIFDIGCGKSEQRVSAFMADIRGGSIVSDIIFASKVSGNKLGSNYCGIPRQPSIRQEYAVVNSWPAFLEDSTVHMLTTANDLVTTSMYALGVITPKRHAMGEGTVSPSTYLSKLRGIKDSFNTYSVPFTNTVSGTGTVTGSVDITFPFTFYKQPIAIYISIGGNIQLTGESITDDFGGKSAAAIVDPQLHIGGSYTVPATGATTASVAYRLRGFDSGAKTVKGNILILFD